MTNYCKACDVNWFPYQTQVEGVRKTGICPECGGGTVRRNEPASLDADARFKAAQARRASEAKRLAFEEFCAERDRLALERQLEEITGLPEAEPQRRVA